VIHAFSTQYTMHIMLYWI